MYNRTVLFKGIVYKNSRGTKRIDERKYLYYKGFLKTTRENVYMK